MRVFMLTLLVGLSCAAPQGYTYQIEVDPSGNSIQDVTNQYQFVQQQQPQNFYQVEVPQLQQLRQTVTLSNPQGAYQFGNQLLQSAQQVVQYEQQHQQEPEENKQQISQQTATVIEQPTAGIVETIESAQPLEKSQIVTDTQPQFIIKSRVPPKPEVLYQPPAEEKPITFQKEFFYLSAPKEEEETPKDLEEQLSILQKKLRVVFIKAPENNGLEKAALQLAQQSANSQTAIYVLSKQHDAAELAQKFQSIQTSKPQSPEVAFIKYRTPEEAEHAQRVIQAQYESLDGPNHINRPNTGVTHNFVGTNADVVDPRKPLSVVDGEKLETTKPVSKYLPASVRH